MSNIIRNTDPLKGPPDGVTADVQCVVTQFEDEKSNGENNAKVVKAQAAMDCRIFCAYSEGTIGLSVREANLLLTVRVDELFEILKEAANAAQELQDSMPIEFTDAELEKRWLELLNVPLDESDSSSGLVLAEKWWVFPKGSDKDEIFNYFSARHSKGLQYLISLSE